MSATIPLANEMSTEALNCVEISSGRMQSRFKCWNKVLTSHTLVQAQIVLTSWKEILEAVPAMRDKIIGSFQIPRLLTSQICLDSNGFSGCEPIISANGLQAYNHWSRFTVKQTFKTLRPKQSFVSRLDDCEIIHDSSTIPHGWEWIEIGFYVHWTPPHSTTMLCFNIPPKLQISIEHAVKSHLVSYDYQDPYSLFSVVTAEIVGLYDVSVWSLRNHVCSLEAYRYPDPDFPLIHEIARHTIHVSETLTETIKLMRAVQRQQLEYMSKQVSNTSSWNKTQNYLQFQLELLHGLLSRSESNRARVQNEVTLAFNLAAQRDSQAQARIAEEAKKEASAMKAIAVLTMTFLPATFVSSIFSMSFFSYDPGQSGSGFSISNAFWIYWLFAVPLCLLTLGTWIQWEKGMLRRGGKP